MTSRILSRTQIEIAIATAERFRQYTTEHPQIVNPRAANFMHSLDILIEAAGQLVRQMPS